MRPTSLIRSDSNSPQFSAPANNIRSDAIDCGIKAIPFCLPRCFHRFATINWFLFFFVVLGIVQGSAQAYFESTARHIAEIFGFSETLTDWLLMSHDLFMGLVALIVAYWGNKIHRPAWMGGIACFQGISCLLVFIPYLEHKNMNGTAILRDPHSNLCNERNAFVLTPGLGRKLELVDEEYMFDWVTLIIMFVAQFFVGLGNISFFSHGFSYMDDNVEPNDSLIYIAIGLAVRLSTIQFGSFMAWSLLSQERSWWVGYSINGPLLVFAGTMISLFPRSLLKTVIKETAASILDVTGRQSIDRFISRETPKHGFFSSLKRVITNKIMIVNTLAIVLMLSAMANFNWFEGKFMESQYYLPNTGIGFDDPWKSRLWKQISKPPIMFMMILISGLVITKAQPRARSVATWNVITTLIVAGIYLSYGFIDCKKSNIAGAYKNHLTTPYCSILCNCDENIKFEPVCTQDVQTTYYSPCHAGCKEIMYLNNVKIFGNCTCVSPYNQMNKITTVAMQGACDNLSCQRQWIVFQTLTVLSAALLGSGFLGSFFINLRSVSTVDKAMAIGFQFGMIGLHSRIPVFNIYQGIANSNCQYYNDKAGKCNLHSEKFGDYISILTACLLLASALLYGLVVFFARNMELFEEEPKYPPTPSIALEDRSMRRSAYSTPSTAELESQYARPLRPARSNITSGVSTRVNSIEFRNPEEQPLTRDQAQRNVVNELKRLTGTQV